MTVAFGDDSRADAVWIGGALTQEELDAIPDVGVPYYFEPGDVQADPAGA
ncbi:hypothetical protein [Trueperella sp.]